MVVLIVTFLIIEVVIVPVASSGRVRFLSLSLVELLSGLLVGFLPLQKVDLVQQRFIQILKSVAFSFCGSELLSAGGELSAQLADLLQKFTDLHVLLEDERLKIGIVVSRVSNYATSEHTLQHLDLPLFYQ